VEGNVQLSVKALYFTTLHRALFFSRTRDGEEKSIALVSEQTGKVDDRGVDGSRIPSISIAGKKVGAYP